MDTQREVICLAYNVFDVLREGLLSRNIGRLLNAVQTTHKLADASIELLLRYTEAKDLPDCSKGCSYCCHQGVACTVPEAFLWSLRMVTHSNKVISARYRTSGMDETSLCRKKMPCAALIATDDVPTYQRACFAYAVRPIACRSVAVNGAGVCKKNFGQPDALVPSTAAVRAPAAAAGFATLCAVYDVLGHYTPVLLHKAGAAFLDEEAYPEGVLAACRRRSAAPEHLLAAWLRRDTVPSLIECESPYAPLPQHLAAFAKAARHSVKRLIEQRAEWAQGSAADWTRA